MNGKKSEEYCMACKLISVGTFCGIGGYLFMLGSKNKATLFYRISGAAVFSLGVGEIFDWSPFRNKQT